MEPELNYMKRQSYVFTLAVEPSKHAVCRIAERLTMEPEDVH